MGWFVDILYGLATSGAASPMRTVGVNISIGVLSEPVNFLGILPESYGRVRSRKHTFDTHVLILSCAWLLLGGAIRRHQV